MRGAMLCLSADLTTHAVPPFKQALQMGRRDAVRGTQRQRTSLRECSAHIAAVAAATPQERAAAAVPALRRGADNERPAGLQTSGGLVALLGSSVAFGSSCG